MTTDADFDRATVESALHGALHGTPKPGVFGRKSETENAKTPVKTRVLRSSVAERGREHLADSPRKTTFPAKATQIPTQPSAESPRIRWNPRMPIRSSNGSPCCGRRFRNRFVSRLSTKRSGDCRVSGPLMLKIRKDDQSPTDRIALSTPCRSGMRGRTATRKTRRSVPSGWG